MKHLRLCLPANLAAKWRRQFPVLRNIVVLESTKHPRWPWNTIGSCSRAPQPPSQSRMSLQKFHYGCVFGSEHLLGVRTVKGFGQYEHRMVPRFNNSHTMTPQITNPIDAPARFGLHLHRSSTGFNGHRYRILARPASTRCSFVFSMLECQHGHPSPHLHTSRC